MNQTEPIAAHVADPRLVPAVDWDAPALIARGLY